MIYDLHRDGAYELGASTQADRRAAVYELPVPSVEALLEPAQLSSSTVADAAAPAAGGGE